TASLISPAGPSFRPSPESVSAPTCATSLARAGGPSSSASSAKSSSHSSRSASSTGATTAEPSNDGSFKYDVKRQGAPLCAASPCNAGCKPYPQPHPSKLLLLRLSKNQLP